MFKQEDSRHIVVFDGVCHFCNGAVNFIIKRDPNGVFAFTPMQSELGKELLAKYKIESNCSDTLLLIKDNQAYMFTDAALEIAKELTGLWYCFNVFRIIPRPIRDYFYKAFAKNRYRLFGMSQACMVPTENVKGRFIGV